MNFMRLHWFDVGLAFAFITGGMVFLNELNPLSLVLWLSIYFPRGSYCQPGEVQSDNEVCVPLIQ